MKYCCERFKISVTEQKVISRAEDSPDETEWYLNEGMHLYYCPFCGTFIKGEGFGDYDNYYPPMTCTNKKQWKKLYVKAKKGDSKSQFEIALYYENGLMSQDGNEIVSQKPKRAFQWYLLSAKQGDADAQIAVGNAYSLGGGIKRDYRKAIKWTKKAVKQGVPYAAYNLGTIYRDLQKPKLAFKWYGRAVTMGDNDALLPLALCHLFGFGTSQSYKDCNKFLKKIIKCTFPTDICEQTTEEAQYWLGILHLLGKVSAQKSAKKARTFLEAANKDNDFEQANSLLNLIGKTEYIKT